MMTDQELLVYAAKAMQNMVYCLVIEMIMRLKNWIGSPRRLHLLGTGGGECLRPTGGEGGVDYPGLDQN